MTTTTCKTCRFWQQLSEIRGEVGNCCRHAPSPGCKSYSSARWPVTHESNWCGVWEAKP